MSAFWDLTVSRDHLFYVGNDSTRKKKILVYELEQIDWSLNCVTLSGR